MNNKKQSAITTQKNIYSIEQDDDPYCASFTNYIFLAEDAAIVFAKKNCSDVRRIAKWEYDESLRCYKKL